MIVPEVVKTDDHGMKSIEYQSFSTIINRNNQRTTKTNKRFTDSNSVQVTVNTPKNIEIKII
jgi:hypothetical protein